MCCRTVATILAGPNALVRQGIARILPAPRFRIIASGPIVDLADTRVDARYESSLLVIVSDENPMVAIDSIVAFKQQQPRGRVVLLGCQWQSSYILAAFQAGANLYVAQVASSEELLKAIELIILGQTLLPSELLPSLQAACSQQPKAMIATPCEIDRANRTHGLSLREQDILSAIAQGASNKTIAREFNISDATVKAHAKTIFRKIGVANRTQAAIWAMSTEPMPHRQVGQARESIRRDAFH